jgi:hypothetical protein
METANKNVANLSQKISVFSTLKIKVHENGNRYRRIWSLGTGGREEIYH